MSVTVPLRSKNQNFDGICDLNSIEMFQFK